jgi:hypothetical protein
MRRRRRGAGLRDLAGLLSAAQIAQLETAAALDVVRDAMEIYPDRPELRFRRAVAAVRHLARGEDAGLTLVAASSLRKLATRDLEACLASAGAAPDADERWRDLYPWRYLGLLDLLDGNPTRRSAASTGPPGPSPTPGSARPRVRPAAGGRRAGLPAGGHHRRAEPVGWLRGGQVLEELGFATTPRAGARDRTLFPGRRPARRERLVDGCSAPLQTT